MGTDYFYRFEIDQIRETPAERSLVALVPFIETDKKFLSFVSFPTSWSMDGDVIVGITGKSCRDFRPPN